MDLQSENDSFVKDSEEYSIVISNIDHLKELLTKFVIQDTFRYQSAEDYIDKYHGTYDSDNSRDEEDLQNISLEIRDILKKTGKEDLYIPEEDRVYDDLIFLKWHKKYLSKYYKKEDKVQNMPEYSDNNKKQYDITVFGGCSVDLMYYQLEDNTYPDEPKSFVPGGKGANQAVAAARAGATVNLISRVGNDELGKGIVENLNMNGVTTNDVEMLEDVQNDIAKIYINNIDADNQVERISGAINSFTPDMVDTYKDDILSSKVVVAQMKVPKEVSEKLINFCYDNYIPIIITPCRPEKLNVIDDPKNAELIDKISFITCNKKECKAMFGTDNVEECIAKYPNKLIVTLGADGVMYNDGNKTIHIPALKLDKVVDTIGAGDTFNGNLAASLVKGCNLKESIFRAQFASAIKIGIESAQDGMPYKEQLDKFIELYQSGKKINWQDIPQNNSYTFPEESFNHKML